MVAVSNAHIIRDEREVDEILKKLVVEIAEHAVARDASGEIAYASIEKIAGSGLLGLNVPKQYGGIGASALTIVEVCRAIGQADPSVAQLFQPHFAALDALSRVGTEQQKQFFFAEVLDGAWIGNGTNEIGVSRGFENIKTRVIQQPNGDYILNGEKFYSTGASIARWIAVMAKDQNDSVGVAYVRNDAKGLTIQQDWNGFGQRGTSSGTTTFQDVRIAAWHFVERWKIFDRPQSHGSFGQLHHIGLDLGVIDAALQDASEYVRTKSRPATDSPYEKNSDDPVIIHRFGQFNIQRRAAKALLDEAARQFDLLDPIVRNPTTPVEQAEIAAANISLAVAAAKAFTAEQALQITSHIFEFMGASGTDKRYGFDRHWRNSRTHTLHDPVRWKIHHLGNYQLNQVLPPNSGIL